MLRHHSSNVKIVRLYAMFLEHVKHDPWNAARWFAEAEKLELQVSKSGCMRGRMHDSGGVCGHLVVVAHCVECGPM